MAGRPPLLIRQRCSASGENFYSYGMKPGGSWSKADINTGKVECPVCGKTVTLRKHTGTGIRSTIPIHNKASK